MNTHDTPEVDELWTRFHKAVNMSSRELVDWLGVQPDVAPTPGPDGPAPLGMAAVGILGKRKVDLTAGDLEAMRKIVDIVADETAGTTASEAANDERKRHRLMSVGHDPLRDPGD
ncbi:DUF3140 domain-containing protein [Phytoactinopolyspora alkaliphila]|uniref:DUF3140 domain-containing protein n=1 Tax=Phytoactinopolyspora alkaliphila TaxID=1783498 RepID=A0A6N9YIV4_9ACTN|nr:DUF3140 domain-containing protein [Phytoactinopolyspora alkaliphila]NED94946.1 DUF3140 domain-containing protein [Phytoactinopolyspora alkaliphila]